MKYKISKIILIIICAFVGIGAVYGSICMFIDPTGRILKMDNLLPYFRVLPLSNIFFKNYIFSGISLLIVNGIPNICASILLLRENKKGILLGLILGFVLMLWITIQFIILPNNILSKTFFIIGLFQVVIGYATYVYYEQKQFKFNIDNYRNINKNKDVLVIYFSRDGYTKKLAYEYANKIGAYIKEIKAKENINGILGFWWCGRFGMHKWGMKIENIDDINKYKEIVIASPVWVFSISAPVREFCYKYKNDINSVSYLLTHFMNNNFESVADELDKILGKKRKKYLSYCVRFGKTGL